MNRNSRFLVFCLAAVLLLYGAIFTSTGFAATPASISVDVVPANPAPYEDVTITLSSYAVNLDSVQISWSAGGKSSISGIGKKSFIVQAGAAGSQTTISAVISLPDGNVEKRIIIAPGVMVLLWQANDSYVPPFYRGKALPSADSEIKVVAMPEVKGLVESKNMTYAWKKDYTNDAEASGYGKNSFVYDNDYLEGTNTVSVTATTVDQKYSLQKNVEIGNAEPKILFYKNDASLGTLWERALTGAHRIQESGVIEAAPYFISPKELLNPILSWTWSINDRAVTVQGFRKNLIPVKAQTGATGTSKLRLDIENKYKIFETASSEINIEF